MIVLCDIGKLLLTTKVEGCTLNFCLCAMATLKDLYLVRRRSEALNVSLDVDDHDGGLVYLIVLCVCENYHMERYMKRFEPYSKYIFSTHAGPRM